MWKEIAAKRQAETLDRIPAQWRIGAHEEASLVQKALSHLDQNEKELVTSSVSQLLEQLRAGKVSAEALCTAFAHSAAIAHQLTNCVTAFLYEDALVQAKALDQYFGQTGKLVGPLHGLPISIKDSIEVAGTDCSLGVVSRCGIKSAHDAPIVAQLKRLGAIVIVKATASAATMSCDGESNLFGRTLNPLDIDTIPGSSSCGDATLLTMHATCFGIGTDLGGSLRFPSSLQNLVALKPSSGTLPGDGIFSLLPEVQEIPSVPGPLARTVADLRVIVDALIPQKTVLGTRKVALLRSNGVVEMSPVVLQTLEDVADKLVGAGWALCDWALPLAVHRQVSDDIGAVFGLLGHDPICRALEGEPCPPRLTGFLTCPKEDLQQAYQRLIDGRERVNAEFDRLGVDFVLSPITEKTKYKWGEEAAGDGSYTGIWNVCDFSLGVVSVMTTDGPVGLQLVGRKKQEREIMTALEETFAALAGN